MRPAEKPVSHEKMREILAKRTHQPMGNDARSAGLTQQPDAVSRDALAWREPIWYERGVVGCIISTCDRYRIDKCGNTYTAWRRALRRDHLNLRLGECDKKEAAQALCQSDLDTGEPHVSRT